MGVFFLCSCYSQKLVSIGLNWVCYLLLFKAWVLIVQKFRAKVLEPTVNPDRNVRQKTQLLHI